jgi:hypothetical protein
LNIWRHPAGPPAWLMVGILVAVLTVPSVAAAQGSNSSGNAAAPLDGRLFKAGIVREDDDGKPPLTDHLAFENGKFSSVICKRYNFSDAPYWVRIDGDRIHFLAELSSPTDGKMVWQGTIRGNSLEGTMRWTKKRWYWTIDTEHRIRGTLESGSAPRTD